MCTQWHSDMHTNGYRHVSHVTLPIDLLGEGTRPRTYIHVPRVHVHGPVSTGDKLPTQRPEITLLSPMPRAVLHEQRGPPDGRGNPVGFTVWRALIGTSTCCIPRLISLVPMQPPNRLPRSQTDSVWARHQLYTLYWVLLLRLIPEL